MNYEYSMMENGMQDGDKVNSNTINNGTKDGVAEHKRTESRLVLVIYILYLSLAIVSVVHTVFFSIGIHKGNLKTDEYAYIIFYKVLCGLSFIGFFFLKESFKIPLFAFLLAITILDHILMCKITSESTYLQFENVRNFAYFIFNTIATFFNKLGTNVSKTFE